MSRIENGIGVCLMAAFLLAACGGDAGREPAEGSEPSDAVGRVEAAAASEMAGETRAEPATTGSGTASCVLGDYYFPAGNTPLELRLPEGGNSIGGYQVGAMEYDRETMMKLISKDGELAIASVEAPVGTVYYTAQDLTGPESSYPTHTTSFTFEHAGKWYRGGIPIRQRDAELVKSCASLMPSALATLRVKP